MTACPASRVPDTLFQEAPEADGIQEGGFSRGDDHPMDYEASMKASKRPGIFSFELGYPSWCSMLLVNVLRTRCPFSEFVARSIRLQRSEFAAAPAMFPIPSPDFSVFGRMPSGCSARRRRRWHLQRAVHVICMALNFWHFNGFVGVDALRRVPSKVHVGLYRRIRNLILSDGLLEPFLVVKAGRRFPQLAARIADITEMMVRCGCSMDPYSKTFSGVRLEETDYDVDELKPYRDLVPDRIVLHGEAKWEASRFLDEELKMAYLEPESFRRHYIPKPGEFPIIRDSEETIGKLARLWDARGLLYIHDFDIEGEAPWELTRVFGCFKSNIQDRQIGDRRGRNSTEQRLLGPSSLLPAGADLLDLKVDCLREKVVMSITDRKDFYHQMQVSKSRAFTNSVGPTVPASFVKDTVAYAEFLERRSRKKRSREEAGDELPGSVESFGRLAEGRVHVAFNSVFQGDHAGVEFATNAHSNLLRSFGCLAEESNMVASRPLFSNEVAQGLVIDDYFSVSIEDAMSEPLDSRAVALYHRAQGAYGSYALKGSTEKDVVGETRGKLIGAELNSSDEARKKGVVSLGSSIQKRLALSWMTMQLAQLPMVSDALWLCCLGGWVSALAFRRPFMDVLQDSFSFVDHNDYDPLRPKLKALPRRVAGEVTLLAVLAPLMSSNLAADWHPTIFCSDASLDKCAVLQAEAPVGLSRVLFKSCKSKGAYTRLQSREEQILKEAFGDEPEGEPEARSQRVDRPLAYRFDFLEVFAGSAKVTSFVALHPWISVGPPIDLSYSVHYDLEAEFVMQWISHLLCNGLLKGIMMEPPCTTFSIMRRPRLRSKETPYGFRPHHRQTQLGTTLGKRGFQALHLAANEEVAGLLETPFSSSLRHLPGWDSVEADPRASSCRTDSCRFGSPHLKSFRFLGVNVDLGPVALRCQCSGLHLQVQGSLTKASAVYTDSLAEALAEVFITAILAKREPVEEDENGRGGNENLLVNEVAKSLPWKEMMVWSCKPGRHINLLELSAVEKLVEKLSRRASCQRLVILVDSIVVRGCVSKGRSASRALTSILRRLFSLMVAADFYAVLPYAPTRLNVADDPTRDVVIREPIRSSVIEEWAEDLWMHLSILPKLKRPWANWASLILKLGGSHLLSLRDRSLYRRSKNGFWPRSLRRFMDFDQTLGFPGEGPSLRPAHYPLGALFSSSSPFLLFCLFSVVHVSAMPMQPRTAAEIDRAGRRSAVPLQAGRRVLPATNTLREHLLIQFWQWTGDNGIDWNTIFANPHRDLELFNDVLTAYGRELYESGRPYLHFAETLNGISQLKPSVKRNLQGAWNLAFGWVQQEPVSHHVSMPYQILLSLVVLALTWGWPAVAGCLSIGWGALLRAGEITSLVRSDILFPVDVEFTMKHVLISLREPKTRFSGPRHQSAKLDFPDLVEIAEFSFGSLQASQHVWPHSAQSLRSRLKQLLTGLGLKTVKDDTGKPLDLGSLRAGGATFLMDYTEDSSFVMKRGRWSHLKTMQIYVQEVTSATYMSRLDAKTKSRIIDLARHFGFVFQHAKQLQAANIPSSMWFSYFRTIGR